MCELQWSYPPLALFEEEDMKKETPTKPLPRIRMCTMTYGLVGKDNQMAVLDACGN